MELEAFIDQFVAEKNLDSEDPEVVEQIKSDIAERIENRVNVLILSSLAPESLEQFEQMIGTSSPEEVQAFIRTQIPDFDQKVAAELMTFRAAYLG